MSANVQRAYHLVFLFVTPKMRSFCCCFCHSHKRLLVLWTVGEENQAGTDILNRIMFELHKTPSLNNKLHFLYLIWTWICFRGMNPPLQWEVNALNLDAQTALFHLKWMESPLLSFHPNSGLGSLEMLLRAAHGIERSLWYFEMKTQLPPKLLNRLFSKQHPDKGQDFAEHWC